MAIVSTSSKVFSKDVGRLEVNQVFDGESTDETKSTAVDVREAEGVTLVVEAGTGVSGGVVELEGAVTSDYAGTWIPLGSITTNGASVADAVSVSASANPESNAAGLPIPYVRARISTVISNGTIDAYIIVKK